MDTQNYDTQTIKLTDIEQIMEEQREEMAGATGVVKTAIELGAVEKAAQLLLHNDKTSITVPVDLEGPELYAALMRSTGAELDAAKIPYPELDGVETAGTDQTLMANYLQDGIDAGAGGPTYFNYSATSAPMTDWSSLAPESNDGRPESDFDAVADYEVHLVSYPVANGWALQKDHLFIVVTDHGGNPLEADEAHLVMRAGPSTNKIGDSTDTVIVSDTEASRADLQRSNLTDQGVGTPLRGMTLTEIESRLNSAKEAFNDLNIHYGEVPIGVQANSNTFANFGYRAVTEGPTPAIRDSWDVPGYMHNMQPFRGSERDSVEYASAETENDQSVDLQTTYFVEEEQEYDYGL